MAVRRRFGAIRNRPCRDAVAGATLGQHRILSGSVDFRARTSQSRYDPNWTHHLQPLLHLTSQFDTVVLVLKQLVDPCNPVQEEEWYVR